MTTRSDPYAVPNATTRTDSGGWRRGMFAFVLTLVAILVFMASFAVGYARVNEGKVLPGVDIAGVSLSGLTRDQAAAKLQSQLPSLSAGDLVIDINGAQQTVPYASFERTYDTQYMLDQAFNLGRSPNFVQQIQEQLHILLGGLSVEPQVAWNSQALADEVAHIAQAAQSDPVSASLRRVDGHYVVTPATTGLSVDVEGAVSDALAVVNNTSPASTRISVRTSVVPAVISTEQAQAAADSIERVVGNGVAIAGEDLSTQITADELRGWVYLAEAPGGGDWQVVIDRDPIQQFVANYAMKTDVPATNATFKFNGGEAVGVTVVPSKDGRAADVETTTNSIMDTLQARASGADASATVPLALGSVAPQFTTDDAQAISQRVSKIGEWTTNFTPSELNGNGVNLQIPTDIIDGYVVEPGATFDFLDVIGPITSPPYTAGAAIVNGRTKEGVLGGGMCSVSTTVFNAALRAGLAIAARRNHSYYITRYPVGLDATVWVANAHSRQTVSFINDLQFPILIKGIYKPGAVTFELYGVPDGRTVELSEPVVENAETADNFYEYTNSLPAGRKDLVEYAVDGFDSTVQRTVRDATGSVIHQDTFKSDYKTITGLVMVGRYPTDPPEGTKVLESVWKARH